MNNKPYREFKNSVEGDFQGQALSRLWSITKKGWPDFFCLDQDGATVLVECKKKGQHLRFEQYLVLCELIKHGFDVRIHEGNILSSRLTLDTISRYRPPNLTEHMRDGSHFLQPEMRFARKSPWLTQ